LQVEEVDHLLDGFAVRELERAEARQEEELLREARAPVGMAAEQQVLQHGRVLEELDVLKRARDPAPRDLVRRHAGDVLVAEDQAAARRVVDPRDEIEDGRLARAVRTDDREDLPLFDGEGDAVDGANAAEVDDESVRGEEGQRRRSERMYA